MTTIHRIQPRLADLVRSTRIGSSFFDGEVPFRLFYLVPDDVLDAFMQTLTYCAATPLSLHNKVAWENIRVDVQCTGSLAEQTNRGETKLEEVVDDLYRFENPWWAVVPIPRTNMKAGALRQHIKASLKALNSNFQQYDPMTFSDVGQHPYAVTDEEPGAIAQIATNRLPPDAISGRTPGTRMYDDALRAVQQLQPLPGVRVRTPDGIVDDVCLMCPNYPTKLIGECWFGCSSCDDMLRVIAVDGFFAKLRKFDARSAHILSRPVEGMEYSDGQTQPGKDSLLRVLRERSSNPT